MPEPLETVQCWPLGSSATVTAYAPPSATGVSKVNDPLLATSRSSAPLSRRTTVPDSPETVPPIEYIMPAEPDPTLPPDQGTRIGRTGGRGVRHATGQGPGRKTPIRSTPLTWRKGDRVADWRSEVSPVPAGSRARWQ